ncbi:MAG: Helix-turn-helix domain, rpiR family, partial [Firmicutes bacterium]|nr:Helix-turn-helix domain, rpiR family [Bacillota bacterium]
MDASGNTLMGRIEAGTQTMSKGQRAIAQYILKHYDRAAYLTAARIGEEA